MKARKVFILTALLLVGGMASAQVRIKGSVYGGGEGVLNDETRGLVTGNTLVEINGGTVERSIYGGGKLGSVGTFTGYYTEEDVVSPHIVGEPKDCVSGTGLAKVLVKGGIVGVEEKAHMPNTLLPEDDDYGWIFGGGRGETDTIQFPKAVAMGVVDSTYLEISGSPIITASVYGGSENGLVLGNTHVKVLGGQIGLGYNPGASGGNQWLTYTENQWNEAINAVSAGDDEARINAIAGQFYKCDSWPFGDGNGHYYVYDIFADEYDSHGGSTQGSDGYTFFGKVFGGGSGYYPFAPGVWRRAAGRVYGNTLVEIEGGHILSSVYGGNEITDVIGKSTVKMSGGTVGIPRSKASIGANPMNSHVFGAGQGDQRVLFNGWTNSNESEVYINGGTVFGSVFGGGEEAHVLTEATVIVKDSISETNTIVSSPLIGTWGTTSLEGNVYGGGRGFSGNILTTGAVVGNTNVNIEGGTMLGSVYGGGRMASVGIDLLPAEIEDPENPGQMIPNPDYGVILEDEGTVTHGYTVVNINGGHIGNNFETYKGIHSFGGNVYGGSKGGIYETDGQMYPLWLDLAKVKTTQVNINDAHIFNNVYGGGEIGFVTEDTYVNIPEENSLIDGNVFGGGYGDLTQEKAGQVYGNTTVNMTDGNVVRSIYGGGDLASVGTFTYSTVTYPANDPNGHAGKTVQIPTACESGGVAKVLVSGGRVGSTQPEHLVMPTSLDPIDNYFGYIFCGCSGESDSITYYKAPGLGVVDSTYLEISGSPIITSSVYGGSENGLVVGNTHVKIEGGQIGLGYNPNATANQWITYTDEQWETATTAVRAGNATQINAIAGEFYKCDSWPYGDGNGHYYVYDIFANDYDSQGGATQGYDGYTFYGKVFGGGSGYYPFAPGIWRRTAGQVNGNTFVEITGGHVLTSVHGGNEIADVLQKTSITMSGGTVGIPLTLNAISDSPSYNHIYGGGEGDARFMFSTWTNVGETEITITGGTVFGSVYGGSEVGHVINNTKVTVKDPEEITGSTVLPLIGTWGYSSLDGNVFGGGGGSASQSLTAGCVSGNTEVNIEGGHVLSSVFGGGRMASVGTYIVSSDDLNYGEMIPDNGATHGYTVVNIKGGTVGHYKDEERLGGDVYGGSEGVVSSDEVLYQDVAIVKETTVNVSDIINKQTYIRGSVYGGGENGNTLNDTYVNISGGQIGGNSYCTATPTLNDMCNNVQHGNVYGGGNGLDTYKDAQDNDQYSLLAGKVGGNTNVMITGGRIFRNVYGGGNMASVGNANEVPQTNGDYLTGLAKVTVTGGFVGIEANNQIRNGMVFGSGRGIAGQDYKNFATVRNTDVTITGNGRVYGSVFGSGESGHTLCSTNILIGDATVGDETIGGSNLIIGTNGTPGRDGNVYGGGCGLDLDENNQFSLTAGFVGISTNVEVNNGYVQGSVYGGGRISSVGYEDVLDTNDGGAIIVDNIPDDYGKTTVLITGDAQIGSADSEFDNGHVFGAGKGLLAYSNLTFVHETDVTVEGSAQIYGSVFGGGEDGHVSQYTNGSYSKLGNTKVTIGPATGTSDCKIGQENETEVLHGNVFGGGRGIDLDEQGHYSATAAKVDGNTEVTVNSGYICRNVYGGGNMASVGQTQLDGDGNLIPSDNVSGWARINIKGGVIGNNVDDEYHGNVFGSGQGKAGEDYKYLANVNNTDVKVMEKSGTAAPLIKGSVFGGGEDGHVTMNTKVTVNGGQIGESGDDPLKGNVYGGGRGIDEIDEVGGGLSPTAGFVRGHTRVYVNGGEIMNCVYGGGNKAVVGQEKVVNINGGTVAQNVFGSCNAVPADRLHAGRKTVNMRGGHVGGNVYGCSYNSIDGDPDYDQDWTAFVNISGGHVDGNVYGAGMYGEVNGSVSVCIGKDAIKNAPIHVFNLDYNDCGGDEPGLEQGATELEPQASTLLIAGNVYGGSDYYGQITEMDWTDYDVTGYSNICIDGTDYNTTSDVQTSTNYMSINGGLFGCGSHCESGALGRHILLKDYGTRNETNGEMTSATRTLTTIQRAGNVIIDHANVNLSGLADISNTANENVYGVMRVSDTLAVINASGIVLGVGEDAYAHMDSIYSVQSLNLTSSSASIYDHNLNELKKHSWYWLGIQDEVNSAKLYNITGTGENAQVVGNPLTFAQENVILYNDTSKLWVRYHDMKENDTEYKQYYGELLGFFRMRGDEYHPTLKDTVSFAYARPKIMDDYEFADDNKVDGGWLSYNTEFNYFTDLGDEYTHTQQYPYINVLDYSRGDREDYRMWVDVKRKRRWYVDGTRGWGRDDKKKFRDESGLYPDKPKKTLYGRDANNMGVGIVNEVYTHSSQDYLNYSHKDDVIYVVGAISAADEKEMLRDSTYTGDETHYPLKLYRYPGGHTMSNGKLDYGGAKAAIWGQPNGEAGDAHAVNRGPGANYGAMLNVQGSEIAGEGASLEMRGVLIDGLYGYTEADSLFHEINDPSLPEESKFKPALDSLPLVLTHPYSTLTMHGGTVLKRGYNNTDAYVWYTDADYSPYTPSGDTIYHGGAIFVDSLATVNVGGLDSIVGNKQFMKFGNVEEIIECNVYLPTFFTHLYISDSLTEETRVGVTSPKRNTDEDYKKNTLSPVALATTANIAQAAWQHCNFLDDQGWFFVNGNSDTTQRTTFYDPLNYSGGDAQHLKVYFGWTWANVVRKEPSGFAYGNIDSREDMAWLISKSTGMNRQTAIDFSTISSIKQTDDFDLGQYVWVPLGEQGTGYQPFAGSFDGRGHLITNLNINYIGRGDSIYERTNYGLFGYVNNSVKRTFVVSGELIPYDKYSEHDVYNIGGLVGLIAGNDAVLSNSEAALRIYCPTRDGHKAIAGGLVGKVDSGEVHSSMAMPYIKTGASSTVGGLVGSSKTGKISNSFVHASFSVDNTTDTIGGLLGTNKIAVVRNCYVTLRDCVNLDGSNFGSIVNRTNSSDDVNHCYVMEDYAVGNSCGSRCGQFAPVISSDMLGYMYDDNKVWINGESDTTMFMMLNRWVDNANLTNNIYARWARPGIQEVNGDLPVLLLDDDSPDDVTATDEFRSLATYNNGIVLQYGGTVRDDDQLSTMLGRSESVFIYGDVNEDLSLLDTINANKVSLYEHAAILNPGKMGTSNSKADDFKEIYVGITFDNTHENGNGYSTPGINYGLVGMGGFLLPRDWHMFSTPLSHAPLGFNYYMDTSSNDSINTNTVTYGGNDHGDFYNNIWEDLREFSWLNDGHTGNNRYWMKGWKNSQIENQTFNQGAWADGYFPSSLSTLHTFGTGCIPDAAENGRYPYGMDFFTWTEPDYHWINFKRNGPNHWHSDVNETTHHHDHIDYEPVSGAPLNVNEEELIIGRGYMAAISVPTFMQSHGTLNTGDQYIPLTRRGKYCTGWNLVGNPYHGYLDFNAFASDNANRNLLATEGSHPFYVVYNADGYTGAPESAFIYYVHDGSDGGAYAGPYLHPHQGFFVQMDASSTADPRLHFSDGGVSGGSNMVVPRDEVTGGSFRSRQPRYPLVNLFLSSDNGCSDVTVIEFERPEWGGATKLRELRQGDGLFYGYHDNHRYAALFAETGTTRVPLWFEAKEDDIFTMKWNTANADFSTLYLIDNITGVEYDMLANDTYTFEGHKQDYYARFYIVFSLTDVEEHVDEDIFAFFDGSQWVVTGKGELDFIDLQGRILYHDKLSGGQSRMRFPVVAKGMYLLRLVNSNETKVQKIIVK